MSFLFSLFSSKVKEENNETKQDPNPQNMTAEQPTRDPYNDKSHQSIVSSKKSAIQQNTSTKKPQDSDLDDDEDEDDGGGIYDDGNKLYF